MSSGVLALMPDVNWSCGSKCQHDDDEVWIFLFFFSFSLPSLSGGDAKEGYPSLWWFEEGYRASWLMNEGMGN